MMIKYKSALSGPNARLRHYWLQFYRMSRMSTNAN